jgi:lipoprotein-anchoring transpeptidase ErfK/SrfK
MKMAFHVMFAVLLATAASSGAMIENTTRVIIDLSVQRAYLMEGSTVVLVAPIASGKTGWSTPTGRFAVLSKDFDHRSRSFGSVLSASGRVINSNATPRSSVPQGGYYRPAPMPYYMEFYPGLGMHAGYLPGYPASHGCVRMPRDLAARFFERVHAGTRVDVIGNTKNIARVRRPLPVSPGPRSPGVITALEVQDSRAR